MERGAATMSKPIRTFLFAGLISLVATGSSGISLRQPAKAAESFTIGENPPLSVMTYNINGLPWPLATGRDVAMIEIARRLVAMRHAGRQPHIVLLQEAFTPEAAEIARSAGYAHAAFGPGALTHSPITPTPDDAHFLKQPRWDRGEQVGKQVGSGLIILSDYPIERVDRMAFPDFACAGWDCLANKGVLIAHVRMPGSAAAVAVVNTHLNARKAAGVPVSRSQRAYARQVALIAQFVDANVPDERALVIGGDMNIGTDSERGKTFFDTFHSAGLDFVTAEASGANIALRHTLVSGTSHHDLKQISRRKKDWIFARPATGETIDVVRAHVPFGSRTADMPLSDHLGYVVAYSKLRAPSIQLAEADMMASRSGRVH